MVVGEPWWVRRFEQGILLCVDLDILTFRHDETGVKSFDLGDELVMADWAGVQLLLQSVNQAHSPWCLGHSIPLSARLRLGRVVRRKAIPGLAPLDLSPG